MNDKTTLINPAPEDFRDFMWKFDLEHRVFVCHEKAFEVYQASFRRATVFERWRNWLRGDRYWWITRTKPFSEVLEQVKKLH